MTRYDEVADWYDGYVSDAANELTALVQMTLQRLLGRGDGRCLDLGCGGGIHIPLLADLGWSVVGSDISADQLRVAQERVGPIAAKLVQADAAALPFEDNTFDAVVSVFTHTDVDDVAVVVAEVARVLRPGGRLVYVGTHPCFVNPFVERDGDRRILHPGYRHAHWHSDGPGLGDGIRRRVGVRHVPLTELIGAVLNARLDLQALEEPGNDDPPALLALMARATARA